jgi:hypothetical protein
MPLIHEFTLPLDNAEPSDLGADRIVVGKTQRRHPSSGGATTVP